MGANLVPILSRFSIENASASSDSIQSSLKDACVSPGPHRLLRFAMRSHNTGNADFNVGAPVDHPEIFEWSAAHGHFHNKHFNEFTLFDMQGRQVQPGFKQGFCLQDTERMDPGAAATPKFICDRLGQQPQGVQPGWADVYDATLPCQFIVIDSVPTGYYQLQATTNARYVVAEDNLDDNTIVIGLELAGDQVVQVNEQSNWRWCNKCQGLAFAGGGVLGACPAGGSHDHGGSGDYSLVVDTGGALGQANWRWCNKCQGLAFGGSASPGACPAGGTHDHGGSGNYALVVDLAGGFGQANWRWCNKCQGLAFGGSASPGACPAGGNHDHGGSGNYSLVSKIHPIDGQHNWRWCNKCQGLAFAGGAVLDACPAGGSHDHGGSGDYVLRVDSPGSAGQDNWRWCNKCQGLAFGGSASPGACPAGGTHDHGGSGNYLLVQNIPNAPGQHNWRWCNKCQGLAFAGGGVLGACPAGGSHDHGGSGDYAVRQWSP